MQPLANRVRLDNVDHARLKVALGRLPGIDNVNQTLVVPTEFEDVQREYPIFIRKDQDGNWVAVALLGLDKGENLFLDGEAWDARYIPAVHRRGPFFLSLAKGPAGAEPMAAVHIDLDDPRVSEEEGEPLFREHGGNSAFLDHVTKTLHLIHEGLSAAPHMYALLDRLGLIQPIEVEVQLGDGKTYHLPSLHTVGMQQLQALTGPQLAQLSQAGFLAPTIFIRSSLPNMNRLIDLKKSKLGIA